MSNKTESSVSYTILLVISLLGAMYLGRFFTSMSSDNVVPSDQNALTYQQPMVEPSVPDVVAKSIRIKHIKPRDGRVVALTGEINANVDRVAQKIKDLENISAEPIYLLIDSPGGSVIHGASLVSVIESSRAPVYTVCMRLCASMAFIVHQYGHKRFMLNRAILMSHDASSGPKSGDMSRIKSIVDFLQKYIDRDSAYIANRAGMNLQDYKNEIMRDMWLDSVSSTERHFNDDIVSLSLSTSDSLEFNYDSKLDKDKSNDTKAFDIYDVELK